MADTFFCRKCGAEKATAETSRSGGKNLCKPCWAAKVRFYVANPTGRRLPRHGLSKRPEHATWRAMITRCTNQKTPSFTNYGGRGIRVCDRWRSSFEAFFADMGPRPSPQHSLGRIDNNGNYEPGNCRWESVEQQQRNRRDNRMLTLGAETMCVTAWAERLGVPVNALENRVRRGWTDERILTVPVRSYRSVA